MSTLPELEEVQEDFNMGIICAQQVLAHFADRLGLTEETALRIASAFGSGMGKAEVCGCVSGSLMVLGMLHGPSGAPAKGRLLRPARCLYRGFCQGSRQLAMPGSSGP